MKRRYIFYKMAVCLTLAWAVNPIAYAQEKLPPVPVSEYGKWGKVLLRDLAPEGSWISYLLMYESKKDTLFVKATSGNTQYAFPGCRQGIFSGNLFASLSNDTLQLQNLVTGIRKTFPKVRQFKFSATGRLILFRNQSEPEGKTLEIYDSKGKKLLASDNIDKCYLPAHGKWLVYSVATSGGHVLRLIRFGKKELQSDIVKATSADFGNFASNGNILAFVGTIEGKTSVYRFNISKAVLEKNPALQGGIDSIFKVATLGTERLQISDDGNKVFFWLLEHQEVSKERNPDAVQVWNSRDKLLWEYKRVFGEYAALSKLAVWDLVQGKTKVIGSQERPKVFLNGNYSHAFTYNPIAYEPQPALNSPVDLYVTDLRNGHEILVKERLSGDLPSKASRDGKYLCYFDHGDWWLYDIINHVTRNITAGLDGHFDRRDGSMPSEPYPYGFAGFCSDGDNMVLYDEFDLWLVSLKSKNAKRLTFGRENKKVYRIAKPLYGTVTPTPEILTEPALNLNSALLLNVSYIDGSQSGYSEWKPGTGVTEIIWEDMKVDQVSRLSPGAFVHVEQSYAKPPAIVVVQKNRVKSVMVTTNIHAQKFLPQKAALIRYNYNGHNLSGILYYPAGYEQEKKYPMIVNIYEKQSHRFNEYRYPSLHNGDGFNISHMCNQGYFVLLPDLWYEFGKTAKSITGSILAAVDSAIETATIDGKKIGIIGHSFGGYETDLILTQTDRFAAGVSGAAWTDLVSSYLYVGATLCKPDFYRAEYDQLRIGKPLFEDIEGYLDNSPVLLAEKIATPLLGWTGEDDRHIHMLQSMELYLALRRLDKRHVLLVYPGDGHNLNRASNQEDLSQRISEWFGHYLKDEKFMPWMEPDYK